MDWREAKASDATRRNEEDFMASFGDEKETQRGYRKVEGDVVGVEKRSWAVFLEEKKAQEGEQARGDDHVEKGRFVGGWASNLGSAVRLTSRRGSGRGLSYR